MNSTTQHEKAKVAVVKREDYSDQQQVYHSLKLLLNHLGGTKRFVRKGEKVLVKPNVLAGEHPDKAVTTHPSVVAAIVRLVGEAGGVALIGDSPAVTKFESVSGITGMTEVAEEYGAALVGLSTPEEIAVRDAIIMRRLVVAREALEVDAIISVSKLKTHGYTMFTGAVKNLFGVVPGLLKSDYHLRMSRADDFAKMLLDVYTAVSARLHVMDAVWGMDGQKGPRGGRPRHVGLLIAGCDGVAVDAVATSIVGIKPDSVPTTRIGRQAGKGVGRLQEIEVVGEVLEDIRVADFEEAKKAIGISDSLPPVLYKFLRNYVSNKPRIDPRRCKLCMTCCKACPPQAISRGRREKGLHIDYDRCIRCYCCLETCPCDAVEVKEGLLAKLRKCWSAVRGT